MQLARAWQSQTQRGHKNSAGTGRRQGAVSPETTLGLPCLLADPLGGRSGQQLSCAEGSDSHEVVV